nr:MAG TPA: hypothetical protein [Caudoviricetes sp.]
MSSLSLSKSFKSDCSIRLQILWVSSGLFCNWNVLTISYALFFLSV